jgi:hypothetical protein
MTAQILAIAAGFVAASLMAYHDYRQTKTVESFLGALFTFGLVASFAIALGPQA